MPSKLKYVGWQVGITYQTVPRAGLDQHYLHDLLIEMSDWGMNFISFMMISHAMNDARHDGYTWPVTNPRLQCYVDPACRNANPDTEFLRATIETAAGLGFHVNLFMNGFWWNHAKVQVGYPAIRAMGNTLEGSYHHCADNADTWLLACAEVADLLACYSQSPVSSYGFEMIGRGGCQCPDTLKLFQEALASAGLDPARAAHPDDGYFRLWNSLRDRQAFQEYVLAIKHISPTTEIWHHGYMEFGDLGGYRFSAKTYAKSGITVAMPCVHTLMSEAALERIFSSAEGFPLVLHVDTRDSATLNYAIPAKSPEYIRQFGEWILRNHPDCLKGVVFFNEPFTSPANKAAVYEVVKSWQAAGLL